MRRMVWAPVVLAVLLVCGSAWAAPVTVDLRVEGSAATLFEGPITTDGKVIDAGDGPHPCDGTNLGANPEPGPTMTSALDDARAAGFLSWAGAWDPGFEDFLVNAISSPAGSHSNDPGSGKFWGYALNFQFPPVGGCQQRVQDGDEVLFVYDAFGKTLLALIPPGDPIVVPGQAIELIVVNGTTGEPVAGARIDGAQGATDADGRLITSFSEPGVTPLLKAHLDGAVRSNAIQLCVEVAGSCRGFVPPSTSPSRLGGGGAVRDSAAPVARITSPRHGGKYRRGPRLLRGSARDDGSGVQEVKLSIRRHVRGRGCRWWSGRRDRFVGHNCRKTFFFAIGKDSDWSYLLPRALGPGRYVVDLKVFDGRRNRNASFVPGQNRVIFEVLGPTRKRRNASATAAAARVQSMVVGRRDVIAAPATVAARETTVRASGRRCRVGQSTPLTALVAALARERVRYAVRDYGSCSATRTGDSRQLFVTRIGKERNKGANGWVYKVNDRAPGRGAAAGRLRRGDRVVWLYCEQDPEGGGCQRSLRVVPAKRSGSVGGSLAVRVFGYDDRARRLPTPGARVTLTSGKEEITSATTAADGTALLTLLGRGRYELAATAPGLVPSFPITIRSR